MSGSDRAWGYGNIPLISHQVNLAHLLQSLYYITVHTIMHKLRDRQSLGAVQLTNHMACSLSF